MVWNMFINLTVSLRSSMVKSSNKMEFNKPSKTCIAIKLSKMAIFHSFSTRKRYLIFWVIYSDFLIKKKTQPLSKMALQNDDIERYRTIGSHAVTWSHVALS